MNLISTVLSLLNDFVIFKTEIPTERESNCKKTFWKNLIFVGISEANTSTPLRKKQNPDRNPAVRIGIKKSRIRTTCYN